MVQKAVENRVAAIEAPATLPAEWHGLALPADPVVGFGHDRL